MCSIERVGEGWLLVCIRFALAMPTVTSSGTVELRPEQSATGSAVYRRAAGPGVHLLREGSSLDAIRERADTLPFVVEGLMTLDDEEIYEI